jgi:enoyl-[acyl-carrier-protein] reductase (NADH)
LDDLKAKYPSDRLHILKLDVVNKGDITAAFKYVEEKLGRIDIVFNNAGHTLISEIEGTPDDVAKKMFDVNFWGAMNVSRESIRFFREVNKPRGGRLWTVSSTAAITPYASLGYYSASKHGNAPGLVPEECLVTNLPPSALEGATEALASELDPKWDIKVCTLTFHRKQSNIRKGDHSTTRCLQD